MKGTNRIFSLDAHILSTLLYRGWSILAGGVTILLIPLRLSGEEQGYYYTFVSLLALQIFFELGLSQVIVQFMARQSAYLTAISLERLEGPPEDIERIKAVVRLVHRWYALAAIIFFVVVGLGGALYFSGEPSLSQKWVTVWLVLVLSSAWNLFLSGKMALLEGLGLVADVSKLRLRQSMAGHTFMWLGLLLGWSVYAMLFVPCVAGIMSTIWLNRCAQTIKISKGNQSSPQTIRWSTEIFPMQWRIAVSWMSGYLMFQMFTPLIFQSQGAIEAGRLGLALAVFTAIQTVGMSWITAKIPVFSQLIRRGDRQELNTLFFRLLKHALVFTAIATTLVPLVVGILGNHGYPVFARIASLPSLFLLAAVTTVNLVVFCAATYMRTHNTEPMMPISVVAGVLTAVTASITAPLGTETLLLGYLVVSTFLTLPWTLMLFRRFIRGEIS